MGDNLEDYYLFIEDSFENHFDKVPIPIELIEKFRETITSRANNI